MGNFFAKHKKSIFIIALAIEACIAACASDKITIAQSKQKRQKLIVDAQKFLGAPYVPGAVGPDTFDCSGFVYFIVRESIQIQLPRMAHNMYKLLSQIDDSEIETGDLLFFAPANDARINHVAIYIGNNQIIHAASDGPKTGVVISSLDESYWNKHYVGAARFLPATRGEVDTEILATDKKKLTNDDVDFVDTNAPLLEANFTVAPDWSLASLNGLHASFRGLIATADLMFSRWKIKPGMSAGYRWNYGIGAHQIPLNFILSMTQYARLYGGVIFTIGTPHVPETTRTFSKTPAGMFGVSFCTPALKMSKFALRFVQDISYTFYKTANGELLSANDALASGFTLSSGLRFTVPVK